MAGQTNIFEHSETQLHDAFERILEEYARNKASLQKPHLAIIGGQPGAGKSTTITLVTNKFDPDRQPVIINLDDFRELLPFEREIFRQYPFELALYTNEDAWKLTSRLLDHVRRKRNNAVYETTLRTVNPIELIINVFQSERFEVDLHALAVNAKHSIQNIFVRYETDLLRKSTARWTPIDFHDDAYRNFPGNVGHLERTAGLNLLGVYGRDGTELYQNVRGTNTSYASEQVIIGKRNMAWSLNEKQFFYKEWKDVFEAIDEREGSKPVWYIESAAGFLREAELLALSRPANDNDAFAINRLEDHTHHHVFAWTADRKELVCFDRDKVDETLLPKRTVSFTAKVREAQNPPL